MLTKMSSEDEFDYMSDNFLAECFASQCLIRKVQVNRKGMELKGACQLMLYAEDVHLLGGNKYHKESSETLIYASKEAGLEVKAEKLKYMFKSRQQNAGHRNSKIANKSVKEDIRPGLIHNRTQQRSHDIQKKKKVTDEENKQQNKPCRLLEAERREEGLNEAIDDSNRGFALLQKMGYKPGMAIGKSGRGHVEPVAITLKSDRSGFGREAALKEIAAEKLAIRHRLARQREKATDTQDYRVRLARRATERQIERDLRKSQRVCEQLDTSKGFDEPAELWFWTSTKSQTAHDKDEEEEEPENQHYISREKSEDNTQDEENISEEAEKTEFESPEKLEILTLYLRRTHFYCIWCGVQFDDDKDLQDSCPGPSRDDH